jgi:phosphatidylserine decarboxylase
MWPPHSVHAQQAKPLQYLVLTLGDEKEATSTINKTLNPEWNQTFDMCIVGEQSAVLSAVCWDKDRFGKDYMGEFEVAMEEIFANGEIIQKVGSGQVDLYSFMH